MHKRNYKLIPSASQQIYRTIPENNQNFNTNQTNEQFTQLTLSQLELLENYDPMVSAKIGVPFIPVQMLARPKDAQQSSKRSIQQIEKDYPKYFFKTYIKLFIYLLFRKNGQPVFEARPSRSSNNLIDIAQTLQLTKSKRIPIERQTTFEKPENESSIEQTMLIKSFENPNRLAITLYSSPEQRSMVKHTNSTRTSSKAHPSQLDRNSISPHTFDQQSNIYDQYKSFLSLFIQENKNFIFLYNRSKDEDTTECNLSVVNMRTQQG